MKNQNSNNDALTKEKLMRLGLDASKSRFEKNIFANNTKPKRSFNKFLLSILVILVILLATVIGVDQYVNYSVSPYIINEFKDLESYDAIIVFNTDTEDSDKLSPELKDCLSTSIDVYHQNSSDKLLLTNNFEFNTQLNTMKDFLIDKNIGSESIFIDYDSSSPYESLCKAKEVYEINNALIISEQLYLPRALYVAENIGINTHGVSIDISSSSESGSITFKTMEVINTFLDFIKVNFSKPDIDFFGEKIPVTGSGIDTHR